MLLLVNSFYLLYCTEITMRKIYGANSFLLYLFYLRLNERKVWFSRKKAMVNSKKEVRTSQCFLPFLICDGWHIEWHNCCCCNLRMCVPQSMWRQRHRTRQPCTFVLSAAVRRGLFSSPTALQLAHTR